MNTGTLYEARVSIKKAKRLYDTQQYEICIPDAITAIDSYSYLIVETFADDKLLKNTTDYFKCLCMKYSECRLMGIVRDIAKTSTDVEMIADTYYNIAVQLQDMYVKIINKTYSLEIFH